MMALINSFNLFLLLILPLILWAIVYDMRQNGPWPVRTQRVFCAACVAIALTAGAVTIHAVPFRDGVRDKCESSSGLEWFFWCVL
jgi:hypothetical protein